MKKHLQKFFLSYDYPQTAVKGLLDAYDKLAESPEFISLVERFYTDDRPDPKSVETVMDEVASATGVHPYTAKFLYYACLTRDLPDVYNQNGISHVIMRDSLEDLRYKVLECMEVHGIPGFFSTSWFHGFFTLRLFKLGRLEFCVDQYNGGELTFGENVVKQGERVMSIHIPSSGEKFDRTARFESYDKAYHFFREVRGEDVKAFMCNSWLLYPDNVKILSEKSNIVSFLNDFRIVERKDFDDRGHDLWRIFGADGDKPYEELPRDTSLRRSYAEWLCAGNKIGRGKGLFVWDPVRKCNIK